MPNYGPNAKPLTTPAQRKRLGQRVLRKAGIKPKVTPKVVGGPGKTTPPPNPPYSNTPPPRVGGGPPPVTKPTKPGKPPKTGGKPNKGGGGKGGGSVVGGPKGPGVPPGIGFNPQKMAATLAGLGYDAEIAAIQQAIAKNESLEQHALQQMQGWGAQVESQRAASAQAVGDIYEQIASGMDDSNANIAALGGEVAAGEANLYGATGEDMLALQGASDQSMLANMAPILAAQSQDYARRVQAGFQDERKDLGQELRSAQKEKGQARSSALLDLMDMAWGRKMDMLQAQTAQQALAQANAMFPAELAQAQANAAQAQAQAQSAQTNVQAEKLALRRAQLELNKLIQNPSGFDLTDPNNRAQVGSAALSGALGPKGAFIINPRVAWENAMNALNGLGLADDPRAVAAAWAAFQNSLNISHTKRMWGEYRVKNGQLIYNPSRKFKKR